MLRPRFAEWLTHQCLLVHSVPMPVRGQGKPALLHVRLAGRDNALNALRLMLAAMVILEHSRSFIHGPGGTLAYAGGFAVDGFFAISGYLIAGSRSRMGMKPYLWRRALRLMPAFWSTLLLTALVIAPLSASLDGSVYSWSGAGRYVIGNSMLFMPVLGIGDTPSGGYYVGLWNAPLWTLVFEAGAYLFFGLIIAFPGFGARSALSVLACLSALVVVQQAAGLAPWFNPDFARLWSFFAAGVLLWFVREWMPSTPWLVIAASGAVTLMLATSHALYLALAPVPLTFVLLWLGARLPIRSGARNDISYGMYLLGCPLQQLMISAGVAAAVGAAWFAVLSVAVTVPVAWASWLLVERPSMRLRRLVPVVAHPTAVVPVEAVASAR
ncbi:acyltransferase family protein [Terrabacter sp. LjRoot27]|uniref:acyltransferase family protein n=1 Tax=Terrabacter sp. LjRoot27 TaxID=3342306 RepID=UPI003F4F7119